jgi:transposase
MLDDSSDCPEWVLKFKVKNTEIRHVNGSYYLYGYKRKYDSTTKTSKKIEKEYLGRITKVGLQPKSKKIQTSITLREYGVSAFIMAQKDRIIALKKHFPEKWETVLGLAYTRFAFQSPVKRMLGHLENSYLIEELSIPQYNEKEIRQIIREIGIDRDACVGYMKEFIKSEDFVLIDATELAYNSTKASSSQLGRNADKNYQKQFNLLYLYSTKLREPTYYRISPGNITEIQSMRMGLLEAGVAHATIIGDKGFYSKKNITQLTKTNLWYIIPLKRNSSKLEYTGIGKDNFRFQYLGQQIWYKRIELFDETIFIFLNLHLKAEEESDYLRRVDSKEYREYTFKNFKEQRDTFGTLSLATNTKLRAMEVYSLYKIRLYIEQSFDILKNILYMDGPGLQSDEMLNGWMFLNHLALQWYYDLLNKIYSKKLSNKISIRDALSLFLRAHKVRINGVWYLQEIIDRDKEVYAKLGIELG